MLITIVVAISVFIVLFVFLLDRQYKTYTNNVNDKISMIFYKVIEEYPQIEKSDLIAILNEKENHHKEWFKEYGIDLEKESAILINDEKWNKFRWVPQERHPEKARLDCLDNDKEESN